MKRKLLTLGIVFALILAAVFTFSSCNQKCEHNWEGGVTKAPTCEEAGEAKYKCTLCEETKTETLDALNHNYYPEWEWNGTNDADLTLVCKNNSSHKIDGISVSINVETTAPTCLEDGKRTYIATASYNGKEYTDMLVNSTQATLEHNYVNGACTKCLSLNPSCKHENTENKVIDAKALGACGGYIVTEDCTACGVSVDVRVYLACDVDINTSVSDDGVTTKKGECAYCGLEQTQKSYTYENEYGCVRYTRYVGSISIDGKSVVENYMQTYNHRNHYTNEVYITSEEAGFEFCGEARVSMCEDCGEIVDYYDFEDCMMITSTDEDGTTINCCERCSLCVVNTYKQETIDCQLTVSGRMTISRYGYSDRVYFDRSSSMVISTNHTYDEPKYNFISDKDCESGYYTLQECSECGYTAVSSIYSHALVKSEKHTLEDCDGEGYIEFESCLCGEEKDYNVDSCAYYYDTIYDEDDDEIEHRIERRRCSSCGLWIEIDSYTKTIGCKTGEYVTFTVYNDENPTNIIFEDTICLETYESHDFNYNNPEVELFGDDCNDGYKVTYKCENCDETYERTSSGHSYLYYTYDFSDYLTEGTCASGGVVVKKCPCGAARGFEERTNCTFDTEVKTTIDNDGNVHNITTRSCEACGTIIVYDNATYVKDCFARDISRISVTVGGTKIINEFSMLQDEYESHKYVYSFEMNGSDCEDGYTANGICQDCGEKTSQSGSTHTTYPIQIVDFSEHNGCKTHYMSIARCACGENKKCEYDKETFTMEENGNTEVWSCTSCQYKIVKTTNDVADGCLHTVTSDVTLKYGSQTIVEFEEAYNYYAHESMVPYLYTEEKIVDGDEYTYVYYGKQCQECQLVELEIQTVDLDNETNGQYYYLYDFTPSESGYYTIDGLSSQDTYAYLYKGNEQIAANDDDGIGNQFQICAYLEAGTKYTYKIRNYNSNSYAPVTFRFVKDNIDCEHSSGSEEMIASIPCQMNYYARCCSYCGEICSSSIRVEEITEHITQSNVIVNENGKFEISGSSCPCGEVEAPEAQTSKFGPSDINLVMIETSGDYYEFTYTPAESGYYTIYGIATQDTKVTLYQNGTSVDYDDDGGFGNNQFLLKSYLTAGETYTYQVRFYNDSRTGDLPFIIVPSSYLDDCYHDGTITVEYDGRIYTLCKNCLIPITMR